MTVSFKPITRKPQTANCKLQTANCELQTANRKLQTANRKLRTANCELRTANAFGFSLIEVLVATALLVMVVGMIGFVFRQSSMSWDSGIRRAEGIAQVRAVMGAIERDLRLAVDAREFGLNNDFNDNSMTFIALADPENTNTTANANARVPVQIKFTAGTTVKRTATRLVCSGGSWQASGTKIESSLLERAPSAPPIRVTFDPVYLDSDRNRVALPAYVTINAELEISEDFSGLRAWSAGPNGNEGDKDDIIVQ